MTEKKVVCGLQGIEALLGRMEVRAVYHLGSEVAVSG